MSFPFLFLQASPNTLLGSTLVPLPAQQLPHCRHGTIFRTLTNSVQYCPLFTREAASVTAIRIFFLEINVCFGHFDQIMLWKLSLAFWVFAALHFARRHSDASLFRQVWFWTGLAHLWECGLQFWQFQVVLLWRWLGYKSTTIFFLKDTLYEMVSMQQWWIVANTAFLILLFS